MFCYQCEQTARGTGCDMAQGVCGKTATTADLQDVVFYLAQGISMYAHKAGLLGRQDEAIDRAVVEALFTTVTNVNFDEDRLYEEIKALLKVRDEAKKLYQEAAKGAAEELSGPATWQPGASKEEVLKTAATIGIPARREKDGGTATSLKEITAYGLKGMAAYLDHAMVLGLYDKDICLFMHKALADMAGEMEVSDLIALALKTGEENIKTMALLDLANTTAYGHPEPTNVLVTAKKGKAILVSGHDLKDLKMLLEQTEGKGVNIYTHGEMLPANAYPELKKYAHLAGNYGGAWQDQQKEFAAFPGAILMTTNCIQKPADNYKGRLFTSGLVAWPGVRHIADGNFAPVIEAALAAEGFPADEVEKRITIGFARNAVLSAAGTVVDLVKKGKIRRFFLVGGCDGAKSGRNYYTDFAMAVPKDCVIMTLACGKYRFNKLEFGDIEGLPRLLDVGQCNDAYSAIVVAGALAEAFGTDVNGLPLSLVLSWYEQKAVVILLSLLHLGIKNIRIGPSLPAFITPEVLDVLVKNFNIMPITTPEEDLKAILG